MRKPRTRKDMVDFLSSHFRYDTMNSWNCSTSYAKCVKVGRLGLTSTERDTCYAMLDVEGIYDASGFNAELRAFDAAHDHHWQIGQNGRSGGYLVLYQGGSDGRVFPGRSTDMGDSFEGWDMDQLRDRVNLVWAFDRACDRAVRRFVDYALSHVAVEKTVMVPKRVTVAERRV